MSKSILYTLASFLTLFSFNISCKQKASIVEPVEELFPITYKFVNNSANNLKAINLTVSTFFPKLNRANVFYENVQQIGVKDTVSIKIDTSTVTKSFGYKGCQKKIEVEVWQPIINSRTYYVSTWVTPIDTIKTKDDATSYFVWPYDTLKAYKTDQHYINY